MNLIIKLILLLSLVFTLTGEVCAQEISQPNSRSSTSQDNNPIHISADHIIQGNKKGSVIAWGRVKVKHKKKNSVGGQSIDQQQNRHW